MLNPSHEPPGSSKAPNQDLKDMDVLCPFKMKIESQHSEHGCIKDQWSYTNQDPDEKLLSGTPSVLQSPKTGLRWNQCSFHLENPEGELKLGALVIQTLVTISKLGPRCKTLLRNLKRPDTNWNELIWHFNLTGQTHLSFIELLLSYADLVFSY